MKKSLRVKAGVTLVNAGSKTVTFVREGMTGATLKRMIEKHKQSFDLARQVLATVEG
jgi:hypothetical protein